MQRETYPKIIFRVFVFIILLVFLAVPEWLISSPIVGQANSLLKRGKLKFENHFFYKNYNKYWLEKKWKDLPSDSTYTDYEIISEIDKKYESTYENALEVFQELISSPIEEEKFAAFMFLNRYKKFFDQDLPNRMEELYSKYCHTWSVCDSSSIRLIGPFLAKKGNEKLANKTITKWINHKNYWINRMALASLLKIIMIKKSFDKEFIFDIVEQALKKKEEIYIEKGTAWLLKTCSRYQPKLIYNYLMKNKENLTRLILRDASVKLDKEKRDKVLK